MLTVGTRWNMNHSRFGDSITSKMSSLWRIGTGCSDVQEVKKDFPVLLKGFVLCCVDQLI